MGFHQFFGEACYMKIGVDANCWANQRGYGRYTRELLGALLAVDRENQYRFFIDAASAAQAGSLPDGVSVVEVSTSQAATQAASASGRRSWRDLWAMRQAVHQHGKDLDLFYFPSVYSYFPPKTRAKVVVTVHDTTAERYPQLIFPNRRSRWFWKLKVQMAVKRADLIATVSEASKQEIVREFGVSENMVQVVPDAVGTGFYPIENDPRRDEVLSKYGIDGQVPFVLYVGGISPHKNLPALVEAHAQLLSRPQASEVNLVLTGDYQKDVFFSGYTSLCETIDKLGNRDSVVFTGFVEDPDLVNLYNAATALIMPSFDEGFGLPAIEAMACGTPVIASRAGALPEVVGQAGRLFSPHAPSELEAHLYELLTNPQTRQAMSVNGLQRARQFSWERSAQAALTVFQDVARRLEPVAA